MSIDVEGYVCWVNEEMDALAKSIKKHGVVSPSIVRPLDNTTDEYEIISGHRQVMASRKAGITEVPALIVPLDRDASAIVQLKWSEQKAVTVTSKYAAIST